MPDRNKMELGSADASEPVEYIVGRGRTVQNNRSLSSMVITVTFFHHPDISVG
jgi:hypothetical protein